MDSPVATWTHPHQPSLSKRFSSLPTASERHLVQFFEDDAFVSDVIAQYLGEGFTAGEPLIVITSDARWSAIHQRLQARGFDAGTAMETGQLTVLDSRQTLSRFMVDGMPHRERFTSTIGPVLDRCRARSPSVQARLYGDMVDLLCGGGNPKAALHLEQLWNELRERHSFSLLCAYKLENFGTESDGHPFREICDSHSHVAPTESYSQLDEHEDRLREVSLLQQRAMALETEIEQRKKAEEALREALRVREDFLLVAGHELKTPLTPLALKIQWLVREAQTQPDSPFVRKVREHAAAAVKQVNRISSLVSELLDVSRITAGRFKVELEDVDLSLVLHELTSRFDAHAAATGSQLIVDSSGPMLVRADRLRLEQVLTNLVDNALKYGQGRPVWIRSRREDGRAVLSVMDQGIGIEAQHLGRIFERFERVVPERSYGGLGLGLYITRAIVEALGGTLGVESQPGKGATFTVTLPLAVPASR